MRVLLVALVLAAAIPARAQSPLAYEVPGFVGGDLDRSDALFRRGLELDPHYTNMRVGVARTLWKRGQAADAHREALAVLDERAPGKPADWTVKDVPQDKALLEQMKGRS